MTAIGVCLLVGVGRARYAPSDWALLVADLGKRIAQVADVRGEQAGERRDRRLHPAGELREEDLARRQAGQASNGVRADRPVTEHGALDRHDLVRPRRVDDGLGRRRLVVAERDRRRAGQERAERLPDRVLGGDPHQAVLDDAVA